MGQRRGDRGRVGEQGDALAGQRGGAGRVGEQAVEADATALNVMSAVGRVVVVAEEQMDAVTAVSGSGPAYVFYLAEALIDAAQEQGLDREQAHLLVYQTLVGAAHLLRHDGAGPLELRRRVTSPNGTTHAALTHLEAAGWAATFRDAVARARRRAEELGR
jgi:pyrroline-5-carboxylate reductase